MRKEVRTHSGTHTPHLKNTILEDFKKKIIATKKTHSMEALHLSTGLAVDVPCLLLDVHRGELVMFGPQRGARFKIGIKFCHSGLPT